MFISSGKKTDLRDIFTVSVMTGSRTSKCSVSSHVGTESNEQDFDADFPIIFRISLMVARVKEVMEALISFSTCLDVISGDLEEF